MMIVITGPTACGKSAVALELAEGVGGEIVSADSMQVYRGLDIGTAKASAEERRRVRHHLIDIRWPWESYDAATFVRDAQAASAGIEARGRLPIVVGGTALYLKALLEGLFDGPPADEALRAKLRAIADAEGPARLHAMLAAVDPESAGRLHPNDQVRVIRALEVYESTGQSISAQQTQFGRQRAGLEARVVCLVRDAADLRERIDLRVDAMFAAGLVGEVRRLLMHPSGLGAHASRALGYQQVLAALNGRLSWSACAAQIKQATHRFARQQANWFRHFGHKAVVALGKDESCASACDRVLAAVGI